MGSNAFINWCQPVACNQICIIPSSVYPHRIQREKSLTSWARSRSSWWWSMYSNWKNPLGFFSSFNQKGVLVPVVQKPFKFKWKILIRIILNTISSFGLWEEEVKSENHTLSNRQILELYKTRSGEPIVQIHVEWRRSLDHPWGQKKGN